MDTLRVLSHLPGKIVQAGYDIYVGPEGSETKLNASLLTTESYTDTGYAGDDRRYAALALFAPLACAFTLNSPGLL